jgi:hypothetical protein
MNRQLIFAVAGLISAFPAAASFPSSTLPSQDSAASQSQASSQKASEEHAPPAIPSPEKKTKKVWTNDNLGEVTSSPISQIGEVRNSSPANSTAAKPASPQVVAAVHKQIGTLQAQLDSVEKQIADLKNFSKGETAGANGMQLHKGYSLESVEEQTRKLEEKRKSLVAQIDTVFDAARKRGIEPGQLR